MTPLCVSIIIPALNEQECISSCLDSIRKINKVNLDIETIVVDNGSSDDTVKIGKNYGAKVLIKKEGTIASLRNYGAKSSKGQILAFLDADCVVPDDWLSKAFSYFQKEDRVILGFRLSIPESSNWVAKCWDLLFVKRYFTGEVEWVPSGNMIMPRHAFISIAGFDETLETSEDCDFCFRLRSKGYKVISSSETTVIHLRPPQSLKELFKKELWHGKEAFRVFINDIYQSKSVNIFRRRNFKVVLYAFCHLIFILFLLFSLIIAFSIKTFFPLFVAIIFPIMISFFLALKYTTSIKKHNMVLGLTVLLLVYGFSRAISLLLYNIIKK